MKDKTARVLAIVALVFMLLFVATLIATFVDHTLLNGAIGFISLGSGVFVLMVLAALKADGRGFSMTKINNEIELQKIEEELERRRAEQERKERGEDDNDDAGLSADEQNDCEKADFDTVDSNAADGGSDDNEEDKEESK